MANAMLTAEDLKKSVSYDPVTGEFHRNQASGTAKQGDAAGWTEKNGYRKISIGGRKYYAHRCAILYTTGSWPAECVDHIDGNRSNNALANLRCVSHQINLQNLKGARVDNRSGELGVHYHKAAKKYAAEIKDAAGKRRHLGLFKTKAEASKAYLTAKRAIHAGCTI